MLFSEILLDLDTGDASMHDVYAKEAAGKINVASAIFEYAAKLAEMPENSTFVQEAAEAAEEAGLPTKPEEGTGLATEAVAQELIAFYDVVVENAKKVKTAADRDMKAIIGLGKKYGIAASAAQQGNFMIAFAKPLAKALVRDFATNRKSKAAITFEKGIFPKAADSEKLIFAYGNCMARLAAVFGMSIGECIEDPTVQEVLAWNEASMKVFKSMFAAIRGGDKYAGEEPKTGFDKGGVPDVGTLYKMLMKGSSVPRVENVGTVTKADEDDIAELITYTYVAFQVSKCLVASAASVKKAGAEKFIKDLCAAEEMRHGQSSKGGQKKISGKFQKINENVKVWAGEVAKSADLVVKTFSDATAALGKIATGQHEGVAATTESYSETSENDFFEEASRPTSKGAAIGWLIAGVPGAVIGYLIGNHNWKDNPAGYLCEFIADTTKYIKDGDSEKKIKRHLKKVGDGCDRCNQDYKLSEKQRQACGLLAEKTMTAINGFSQETLSEWVKCAEKCMKSLRNIAEEDAEDGKNSAE